MYQGFKYVSEQGLLAKENYDRYHMKEATCTYTNTTQPRRKTYMNDIGYVEHDRRGNGQLKVLL